MEKPSFSHDGTQQIRETVGRPQRKWTGAIIFLHAFAAMLVVLRYISSQRSSVSTSRDIVHQLLRQYPLIDGHNDFAIWTRAFYKNDIYQENFTATSELFGQVDFPRLRKGGLGGQFWSVYVECPSENETYEDKVYREIIHDTLQQIDLVDRLVEQYPQYLIPARSAAQVRDNFAHWSSNRISSLMGIEGLHQVGNSASILRTYYNLGVRYATLTHTCHNQYADSEEPTQPLHGGLSPAGIAMVREMNRMGMIVDLSHTSADTQRQALKVTRAPVIFSHSNAYGVYPHTRNVRDDVLQMLKENDGVAMVTFYPAYLHSNQSAASLSLVADHIEYIGDLIGYRHVGLGSDFDGMAQGPRYLEDVSKYPDLLRELLRRGVSVGDLEGLMGLNILRVLEAVEDARAALFEELPLQDQVKEMFT